MKYEIQVAINNIDNECHKIFKYDHSICSGVLGMLEIRNLLDESYNSESIVRNMFSRMDLVSLCCGGWENNPPVVTGLFYGYAGIGYELIKLLYYKQIPSVLWI